MYIVVWGRGERRVNVAVEEMRCICLELTVSVDTRRATHNHSSDYFISLNTVRNLEEHQRK